MPRHKATDKEDIMSETRQLLLQAFLQRIVNSGGRVEREYGLGKTRTDLLVVWPYDDSNIQQIVIELKILYGSLRTTIEEGLAQTWGYMDRCGTDQGHLVIFDRHPQKSWEEKIYRQEEPYRGKTIKNRRTPAKILVASARKLPRPFRIFF